MKILPSGITAGIFVLKNPNINDNVQTIKKSPDFLPKNSDNSCFALQSHYISYFPNISFGKKKRTNSSENAALKEKSGNFKISLFNDVPCPACGKLMINDGTYKKISHELLSVSPKQYLDVLNNYKQYMRPVEESVFNEIYAISQKTGEKDIRELLVSLRDTKLPLLQDAQMRQVKKMIALSKTLPADEKAVLQDKIKKLIQHIYRTNQEAPFRRKILIDRISKVKIRNQVKYERLQNIAQNFPKSNDINSAWIVKYSGKNKKGEDWTSFEIAQRFLLSSVANTDHMLAYSINNNRNDIANYMSMHSGCNSQKRDKSFLQWIYEDKENRMIYLQEYFDKAGQLTAEKIQQKKYKNYVPSAIENIDIITNGRIKLKDNTQKTKQKKILQNT